MSTMTLYTAGEDQTTQQARSLYQSWKTFRFWALYGPLGAGKSVFARALIRHLCSDPALDVPSPTFTLVQTYEAPIGPIWHFDLYRLAKAQEIYELGWEEAQNAALVLIEWPEHLQHFLPPRRLDIHLAPIKDKNEEREIKVIAHE